MMRRWILVVKHTASVMSRLVQFDLMQFGLAHRTRGTTAFTISFDACSTCVRSGLLQFGFNGLASAEEHFVRCLAFECMMWHHLVVLLDIEFGPLSNRLKRIEALLKQAIVFRRSPERFNHRVGELNINLGLDTLNLKAS
jgi:hypothetical protein